MMEAHVLPMSAVSPILFRKKLMETFFEFFEEGFAIAKEDT